MSGSRTTSTILGQLKALPANVFEQLVYDLFILVGLKNLRWRTPGVDAGRDIEGDYVRADLSDEIAIERWYVECKRYSKTLDWPTVAAKLAYAANHNADYLLLVTTAAVSPRCIDEVALHNHNRRSPRLRVWPGHYLEQVVGRYPLLLVKYALSRSSDAIRQALLPLSLTLSKACQAGYAALLTEQDSLPAVEYGATLSELMTAKIELAEAFKGFVPYPANAERDLFDWCRSASGLSLQAFDAYGLRAALAAYRLVSGDATVCLNQEGPSEIIIGTEPCSPELDKHLRTVSLWSNVRYHITSTAPLRLTTQD